jgi:hypothetical protein
VVIFPNSSCRRSLARGIWKNYHLYQFFTAKPTSTTLLNFSQNCTFCPTLVKKITFKKSKKISKTPLTKSCFYDIIIMSKGQGTATGNLDTQDRKEVK